MPLLSIIIPVYNAESYLRSTLDSVLCQDLARECELLLINDGSKDDSLSILREYADRYHNVIVVDKENEGVSATRNRGMDLATGDYIYFMDADDLLHPRALDILFGIIDKDDPDIVVWNYAAFYRSPRFQELSTSLIAEEVPCKKQDAFDWLSAKGLATSLCLKLLKKKLHTKDLDFDLKMSYGEDMFVSWKYVLKSKRIIYIPAALYYYRQTGSNTTSRFHAELYERYSEAFEDMRQFIVADGGISIHDCEKALGYHFASRLKSLTAMECKAPYREDAKEERLRLILNNHYIKRGLTDDRSLSGAFFDMARNGDVKKMLASSRKDALKSRLLFPLKRLLK